MSEPLTAVAKIATSPAQAKVFVALLQAKGIPAHVEGDSLVDQVAVSQRMMNLSGVKVMVPASSLERAKAILAPEDIDIDELTELALRSTDGAEQPSEPRPSAPPDRSVLPVFAALGATGAAIVFLMLWLSASRVPTADEDPLFRYEPIADGFRLYFRRGGALFAFHQDENRNGVFERSTFHGPDGAWTMVQEDLDEDGRADTVTTTLADGTSEVWSSTNDDGRTDRGVVRGADGEVLQRLTWRPGEGWVIEKP